MSPRAHFPSTSVLPAGRRAARGAPRHVGTELGLGLLRAGEECSRHLGLRGKAWSFAGSWSLVICVAVTSSNSLALSQASAPAAPVAAEGSEPPRGSQTVRCILLAMLRFVIAD